MKEEFLHYVWETKQLSLPVKTTEGDIVEIISSGALNHDAGPDFFNAKVNINSTTWVGNVEIHLKSSDWLKHKHHLDNAYNSIILHVVLEHDVDLALNCPTIELKNFISQSIIDKYKSISNDNSNNIRCCNLIKSLSPFEIGWQIERMFVERLRTKTESVILLFEQQSRNWNEVLFIVLSANFGFKTNNLTFELLAKSISYNLIQEYNSSILTLEALLLGQAGMLTHSSNDIYYSTLQRIYSELKKQHNLTPIDNSLWKFSKTHPKNFPTIRIIQLARLLHKNTNLFNTIIQSDKIEKLREPLKVEIKNGYWTTHHTFDHQSPHSEKNLGKSSIDLLIINTIIPVLFAYNKCHNNEEQCIDSIFDFYNTTKPETNNIIEKWKECGVTPKNGLQTQGLIELYNNYCTKGKCLKCSIGHKCLTSK